MPSWTAREPDRLRTNWVIVWQESGKELPVKGIALDSFAAA